MGSDFRDPPKEDDEEEGAGLLSLEEGEETSHVASGNLMDSKTSHLDDLLKEKLELAIHSHPAGSTLPEIAEIACEYSPTDLAYAAGRLPTAARKMIYDSMSTIDEKVEFIINTDNNTRVALLRHMRDEQIKELVDGMSAEDAVFALESMSSERKFRKLMESIDKEKASVILEIKQHRPNTSSRMMTGEFFSFQEEKTIGEVREEIHKNPATDLTRAVFILNEQGQLRGYVQSRSLIVNPSSLKMREVMHPILYMVDMDATREEVIDLVERYKIAELPVVDSDGVLVGVVTGEGVIEAMEDIADETIARMAGTAEKVGEHETTSKKIMLRFPWLLVTLLAGILNGGVIAMFQSRFGTVLTFVLFFVPLITGLSGNIGIQCSSVLVRGMATGMLSSGGRIEAVLKELQIGVIEGVIFGAMSFGLVYGLEHYGMIVLPETVTAVVVGMIVGIGLVGACVTGALLGVLSPLFFARIGIDPAVSSGPIITAFSDFLSMVIYFIIALGINALVS